jgi:hypothetical protein
LFYGYKLETNLKIGGKKNGREKKWAGKKMVGKVCTHLNDFFWTPKIPQILGD